MANAARKTITIKTTGSASYDVDMNTQTSAENAENTADKFEDILSSVMNKEEKMDVVAENTAENADAKLDIPLSSITRHELVSFANSVAKQHKDEPYEEAKKAIIDAVEKKYGWKTAVKYEAMLYASHVHLEDAIKAMSDMTGQNMIIKEEQARVNALPMAQKLKDRKKNMEEMEWMVSCLANTATCLDLSLDHLASVMAPNVYDGRFVEAFKATKFFTRQTLIELVEGNLFTKNNENCDPYYPAADSKCGELDESSDRDDYITAAINNLYYFYFICRKTYRQMREDYDLASRDSGRFGSMDKIKNIAAIMNHDSRDISGVVLDECIFRTGYKRLFNRELVEDVTARIGSMTDKQIYHDYMVLFYNGEIGGTGICDFIRKTVSDEGALNAMKTLPATIPAADTKDEMFLNVLGKWYSLAAQYGIDFVEKVGHFTNAHRISAVPYDPNTDTTRTEDAADMFLDPFEDLHSSSFCKIYNSGYTDLVREEIGASEVKQFGNTKDVGDVDAKMSALVVSLRKYLEPHASEHTNVAYPLPNDIDEDGVACLCNSLSMAVISAASRENKEDSHLPKMLQRAKEQHIFENEHVKPSLLTDQAEYGVLTLPDIRMTLVKTD